MDTDFILPFQLENGLVRGRILRLNAVVKEIIERHQYPAVINRALAEAIALSATVFNCFKFEGTFTLQINGSGPVAMLVVDITSKGHVRACVRLNKAEKLPESTSVQALFGAGYLAFTIDPVNSEERYQGVVELTGHTLAECMHHFFRQSEQVETGIVVISRSDYSEDYFVGALLLQRMPNDPKINQEEADDFWVKCLSLTGTVHEPELLSDTLPLKDLLHRLFWEDGVRLFPEKPLVAQCRCSRERIDAMLKTFQSTDLKEMVVDGKISVTCEFCSQNYDFLPENFDLSLF